LFGHNLRGERCQWHAVIDRDHREGSVTLGVLSCAACVYKHKK
jgi:hypothetical protein